MKILRILQIFALGCMAVQARPTLDSMALYCSMHQACLGSAPAQCTPAQLRPQEDVKYNVGFCDEAKILTQDGIGFDSPGARTPWVQLGRPLRIEYEESGILPLPAPAVQYLMAHLDLAVELVNVYRNSKYTLNFKSSDQLSFNASNGGSLSGNFEFLTRKPGASHQVLYGIGAAALPGPLKILFGGKPQDNLSLRGDALVFLDFQPRSAKTSWQMRLVVFPEDNGINKVMGMGVFRNKVSSYIQDIIGDISASAQEYAKGNRAPLSKSSLLQSPVMGAQLAEFESLLRASASASETPTQALKP